MSMYGANPDQLANLGTTLTRQIDAITQVMGLVDSALNGTTWQGPARERFAVGVERKLQAGAGQVERGVRSGRQGLCRPRRRTPACDGCRLSTRPDRSTYAGGVVHIEFTIEPFVEGHPGAHVLAAIEAAQRSVSMSTWARSARRATVERNDVGALVGAVTDAALGLGATHVSIHLEQDS